MRVWRLPIRAILLNAAHRLVGGADHHRPHAVNIQASTAAEQAQ